MKTFLDYIGSYEKLLRGKEGLLDMFTYKKDRAVYPDKSKIKHGIVFAEKPTSPDKSTYGYYIGDSFVKLVKSTINPAAPFSTRDRIQLTKGSLQNVTKAMESSIGKFMVNYILSVDIFGSLIEYHNGIWNTRKFEKQLAGALLEGKITTSMYMDYLTNGYELAHQGELFVPTISEKSVTIDKKIHIRRDELLKIHKDELNDPKIVSSIEEELVGMYKEYMKGDTADRYLSASSKSYNIRSKKLNIMVGGIAEFGGEGDEIVTITKSLSEGWDKENFTLMANEVRNGSHSRGSETQKGGALTKLIFRAFQDVVFGGNDCKTTRGVTFTFDDVVTPELFIGRTAMSGSKTTLITTDNLESFRNKKVTIRSPMFCEAKHRICYVCAGDNFKKLGITHPGTQVIDVSSTFLSNSMAAMHGSTLSVKQLEYAKYFA